MGFVLSPSHGNDLKQGFDGSENESVQLGTYVKLSFTYTSTHACTQLFRRHAHTHIHTNKHTHTRAHAHARTLNSFTDSHPIDHDEQDTEESYQLSLIKIMSEQISFEISFESSERTITDEGEKQGPTTMLFSLEGEDAKSYVIGRKA